MGSVRCPKGPVEEQVGDQEIWGQTAKCERMFMRISIRTLDASSQTTTGVSSGGKKMRKEQKPAQEKSERKHRGIMRRKSQSTPSPRAETHCGSEVLLVNNSSGVYI